MKRLVLGLGIALIGAAVVLPPAAAQGTAGAPANNAQRAGGDVKTVKPAVRVQRPAPKAPPSVRPRGWATGLLDFAAGGLLGALFGVDSLFGILMVVLLVAIGIAVVRLVLRGREPISPAEQLAGFGTETVAPLLTPAPPAPPASPAAGANAMDPVAASRLALPAGFDLAAFVRTAKLNYVRVKLALDLGKLDELRALSTPQMFAELSKYLIERGAGRQPDVTSLNAELVELVTEADTHRASVRFGGMARAKPGAAPTAFSEIWTLAKPADASCGWLLAGIRRAA